MLSSHETCPICFKEMSHIKKLNVPCFLMNNQKMSFVESICNKHNPDIDQDFPHHIFFQITSLYGSLMYQKVHLVKQGAEIDVNYPQHYSEIRYLTKAHYDHSNQTWSGGIPDVVPFKNYLLELDFPKLEKTIKKIRLMAPFL